MLIASLIDLDFKLLKNVIDILKLTKIDELLQL